MAKKPAMDMQQALLAVGEGLLSASRAPNIRKYKPHQKQYDFHSSPKKRKLFIGGNRSGKSVAGVVEALWRATCTHPYRPELNAIGPNRGRVVSVDFLNGVNEILIPIYKQWALPSTLRGGSWDAAYHAGEHKLYFTNGSTIEFMSSDQKLDKFAGTSRHWVHFDEEPPKAIWQECLARLVDTNGDYWITMTPIEGMTYIYDEMYEPNVDKPDGKVLVIEVNTMQNPYLTEEGIQGLVDSIDSDEAQTRIGGAFIQQGGRIYKNFDPVTGSRHVLAESIRDPATFFPRDKWMWILALDHGLNNPTAVLWIAVNDDGYCVVFDEWYKAELTIDQHAEIIKRKIREHKRFPDLLVGDPAMKQRNGVTKTNIIEEYQKYGLSFMEGNNDVKAGLVRVKKYFNPGTYPGAPGNTRHPLFGGSYKLYFATDDVVYRNPDNSGSIPRLLIDPRCQKLIWELKRYRWKTYADKKKQFENNPYDEPHKKDDHACDALRYAIMTRPDLAANDDELNEGKLRKAMAEHGDMMSAAANWDIADPRAILAAKDDGVQWMPGSPLPRETAWDYDEHMGSAF